MISAADLTQVRGAGTLLDRVTFEVPKGTCLGIVDVQRRSQKALLRILATLSPPTAGTLSIAGIDAVRNPLQARRRIAYACPDMCAGVRLTAKEYFWIAARTRAALANRAVDIATEAALDLDCPIERLTSDGRSALAIAVAFAIPSDVILLDVPDWAGRSVTRPLLTRLIRSAAEGGAAIVTAIEPAGDVSDACDRVLNLDARRVKEGSAQSAPRDESACTH